MTNPRHLGFQTSAAGIHTIVLRDVTDMRDALGPELFNAILRGLILADRLHTAGTLILRILDRRAGTPAVAPPLDAKGDESQVLLWSVTGWMREFCKVADAMLAAGIEGLLRAEPELWPSVQTVTGRWKTEIFARMRNKAGIHVDSGAIERGLQIARAEGDSPASLLHLSWNETSTVDSVFRATFAHDVLIAGIFSPQWTGEEDGEPLSASEAQEMPARSAEVMTKTMGLAAGDHGALPGMMRQVVVECAKALDRGERPTPIASPSEPTCKVLVESIKKQLDGIGRKIVGWKGSDEIGGKVARVAAELEALRGENKTLRSELGKLRRVDGGCRCVDGSGS